MGAQAGLLERMGVRALERRARGLARAPATANALHLLDDGERAALRDIERGGILRSAAAGVLSAAVAAVAEMLVVEHQDTRPLLFWGVVGSVAGVAALIEIAFVSWDALRTVHAMSAAAGVYDDERLDRDAVLTGLARAALEVPNPRTSALGIDPHKETRRSLLLLAAVVYKLKVSATNVFLKLVVRRALGRAVVRSWLPLVAVPATAAWNAAVTALVLREARIRIFGPSLARDVVARLVSDVPSPRAAEALLRAVASCVVRSADLHPNLEHLLAALVKALAVPMPPAVESSRAFLDLLPQLDETERALVLRMLRAAAVIDGRLVRREKALLVQAGAFTDEVERERRRVVDGERLALS
jgi:hypothetical protein